MPLVKLKPETEVFISKRFQQVVSLHILKNLLKRVEAQVPLLLGIHGPSGEGKTFQCENILKNMGVKRFLISGGQLDNPVPGQPSSFIRTPIFGPARASRVVRQVWRWCWSTMSILGWAPGENLKSIPSTRSMYLVS